LRALVRDPDSKQARQLIGYGEKVFQGSLDDPDSLMRAMEEPASRYAATS
jgi:hypothetical protein